MTKLKTPQDVRDYGEENLAWEIYENKIDLATLAQNVLRAIINGIKPVRDELNKEYMTGDRLCYPPDWYDQYVFPLDSAIMKCEDELQERYNDDDSEEDSEW